MEKISHIVGGSSRVGATDNKNAPAVRPGAPAFGRPIGESPRLERDDLSTAQRVGLIQDELSAQKKMRNESKIASDMTTQFFAQREGIHGPPSTKMRMADDELAGEHETIAKAGSGQAEALINDEEATITAPSKFLPRGSYVDVRV